MARYGRAAVPQPELPGPFGIYIHELEGSAAGQGLATGSLTADWALGGSAAGSATAVGTLDVTGTLDGAAAGAGTASGALTRVRSLAGNSAGGGGYFEDTLERGGAIAYWRMAETGATLVDHFGNHSGSWVGSRDTGTASLLLGDDNASTRLTGGYATASADLDFLGNAPFSAEVLIRPTVVSSTQRRLFNNRTGFGSGWEIRYDHDSIELVRRNGGVQQAQSLTPLEVGNRYHIVGTYDGSTLRLYVNGVEVGSGASTGSMPDPGNLLHIGAAVGGSGNHQGPIDEAVIWDRALSAAEVAARYTLSNYGTVGTLNVTATLAGSAETRPAEGYNFGSLEVTWALEGASTGDSHASGALSREPGLAGSTTGAGTATGALVLEQLLAGNSAGASSAAGSLEAVLFLLGSSAGAGQASGSLEVLWALEGSAAGGSNTAGDLRVERLLAGVIAGSGDASGTVTVEVPLVGSAVGTGTAVGAVRVTWVLAGGSAGVGSAVASLTGTFSLDGSSTGSSSAVATLRVVRPWLGPSEGRGGARTRGDHGAAVRTAAESRGSVRSVVG